MERLTSTVYHLVFSDFDFNRFDYGISHVPGKLLYTADTLSRVPLKSSTSHPNIADIEFFIQGVISNLPANADCQGDYRRA